VFETWKAKTRSQKIHIKSVFRGHLPHVKSTASEFWNSISFITCACGFRQYIRVVFFFSSWDPPNGPFSSLLHDGRVYDSSGIGRIYIMIRRYHFHDTRYTHHTSTPFHGTSPVQLGVLFYLIFSNYDWICDLPFADLAGSLADLDSAARHGVVGGLIICCFDYDGWKARGKGACFGANWSKGVEGGSVSIVVERGLTYFWLKEWELKWERGARKGGYGTDKESMIVDQDW